MKSVRFSIKDSVYLGYVQGQNIKFTDINGTARVIRTEDVKILAPVLPSKIVAVGLNYTDHAAELGMVVPSEPVIFLKPSTSIIGHKDSIIYPKGVGRLDYEAELAVVIGKTAKNVPKESYKDYVKGYTCFNDITARDLQQRDGQWTRAKSFDTFAPIGPFIVDDIDVSSLYIRTYRNGLLCQDSNTGNMIFKVPELIEFISSVMTLLPDDIITTGTPSNVGPVDPGDIVEVEIQGIGRLINNIAN